MSLEWEEKLPSECCDSSKAKEANGRFIAGIIKPCKDVFHWCDVGKIKAKVRSFAKVLRLDRLEFWGRVIDEENALIFFKPTSVLRKWRAKVVNNFTLSLLLEADKEEDLGDTNFHLCPIMKGKGRVTVMVRARVDYKVVPQSVLNGKTADKLPLVGKARKNMASGQASHSFQLERGIKLTAEA